HGPARHAAPGTAAAAADRHAARTGVPDRDRRHPAGRDWIARERVSDLGPGLSRPRGRGRDSVVAPDHRLDRRRAVDHVAADADDRRGARMNDETTKTRRSTKITNLFWKRASSCVFVFFVSAWFLSLQAHSEPPFPIVTDQVAGAYKVTVWTDPDATDDQTVAGRFWVTVTPAAPSVVVAI